MRQADYHYDFTGCQVPTALGGSYWVNEQILSQAFSCALSPQLADVLDVALAVYAADRQSPRCFVGPNTGQRVIHVDLSVRNPGIWASSQMVNKLQELLWWLSEDEWRFRFAPLNPSERPLASEQFLFKLSLEPPVNVSLFSGGLDSLAGLVKHAHAMPEGSRVLVSGYTHQRLADLQRFQVQRIRSACRSGFPGSSTGVWHIAVPYGLNSPKPNREEKGQRTRALVFLALGLATAQQARTDTLWVFENGIGALNLPLNETQLGVDNYRGVHPRTLIMAESFFQIAIDRPVKIRNPFLFNTKAEMCKPLAHEGLADLVKETVSCDGYPQRVRNRPQCGHCTSCVLRRQALYCSGLTPKDPGERYRHDMFSEQSLLPVSHPYGLTAMLDQVYKFNVCLDSSDPWNQLCAAFPELRRTVAELVPRLGLSSLEIQSRVLRLFRTYAEGWELLPLNVRSIA